MGQPNVVWKFPLRLSGGAAQPIEMPAGATVVLVAMQDDDPTLWVRCDPRAPRTRREFRVVGTGHTFDGDLHHVGSCIDGPFVWHVLEGRT